MFRLIFMTFFGKPRDQEKYDHAHESPPSMTIPLMVLGVLSIIAAGWQTADKGWFAKFAAPYDVPAIAAEFHIEGAATEHHGHADGPRCRAHGEDHGEPRSRAKRRHGDEHAEAATAKRPTAAGMTTTTTCTTPPTSGP